MLQGRFNMSKAGPEWICYSERIDVNSGDLMVASIEIQSFHTYLDAHMIGHMPLFI